MIEADFSHLKFVLRVVGHLEELLILLKGFVRVSAVLVVVVGRIQLILLVELILPEEVLYRVLILEFFAKLMVEAGQVVEY